ncbi:MAG: hypothetical protein A2Y33_03345 [Spirochaetes bacterium GWF1_51_8]|nr:MAG: hypothetical protein A2Y33_03345 [Spirochaetes bacterium GWF1_51_8]
MTDDEILRAIESNENDLVEFKESISDLKKIKSTVCAFANNISGNKKPGIVAIGVNDKGEPVGLQINDELLKSISNIQSSGDILPKPDIEVKKYLYSNQEIVLIIVFPSNYTPIRYSGKIYIRVGPTTQEASLDQERKLNEKRRSKDLPFDMRPSEDAELKEIDLDFIKKYYFPLAISLDILERNNRVIEEQLTSLRFLYYNGKPTYGAIILFGYDPSSIIPSSYIQFTRFDGIELLSPIKNQKEFRGPLIQTLKELDDLISMNIQVSSDPKQRIENKFPDYPEIALQQLIRNAIMHRNYESTNSPVRFYWFSDRIEIHNPGGLYGLVTPDNIGNSGVTDYRNPLIAEAMKLLGYVQRFGIGIPMIKSELEKNGNPAIEYDFQINMVSAIVREKK